MMFEWEAIATTTVNQTSRAKVFDGWIVRELTRAGAALVFVPDPRHLWKIIDTSLPPHHELVCNLCDSIYPSNSVHSCQS